MPPPCIDYWHPPTDHRPDWNGVASYGPCKPADTSGIFQPESLSHNGQTLVSQGVEVRHCTIYCGYHPENKDSCYADMPTEASVKSLPHLIVGKVKDKQPVIKKDVGLLEKMKCEHKS